nr:restriction endonuclease subunit S [Streptococcus lutetiensis]
MTNKIPNIRFKGFTDDWEQRKLGELVTFSKGSGYSKGDLLKEGTPIILYGRLYTKYETVISNVDTFVEPKGKSVFSKGGEVIVPGSGETAEDISIASVVEESGVLLGKEINSAFLAISISNGKPHKDMAKMAQGKSVVHLHNSDLAKIDFPFPIYEEQCRISNQFAELDNLITLHQRKCEQTKELKKFMLQKMFPKKGEKNPEIRFPGFTDDWEQRKLGEVADKTYGGGTPKTSIEEYWQGNIPWIQSQDLSENKVFGVEPRKYINQKAIENSATKIIPKNSIAIITRVGVGKLALMPISYCTSQDFLSLSSLKINELYATYVIYKMLQIEKEKVQGTSIKGITSAELLSKKIDVPIKYAEQQKVGEYFSNLDCLITLHQRKCEQLKELKKFMLQNMFPKKG